MKYGVWTNYPYALAKKEGPRLSPFQIEIGPTLVLSYSMHEDRLLK
jgi:hypothetical protein